MVNPAPSFEGAKYLTVLKGPLKTCIRYELFIIQEQVSKYKVLFSYILKDWQSNYLHRKSKISLLEVKKTDVDPESRMR